MSKSSKFDFLERVARILLVGGGIFAAIALIMFLYHQRLFDFKSDIDNQQFSNFGGFLSGSVGIMWSLASVLLFYVTLNIQKSQIDANQKEAEIKIQQINDQNKIFLQDRVEATFFNLLNYHHHLISDLEVRDPLDVSLTIRGRETFKKYYDIYKGSYILRSDMKDKKEVIKTFQVFLAKYNESIGRYFRNLYNIVKFIDMSNIVNKQDYINILRAQLTSNELVLLFYNCITEYGKKFYTYAIQYELFDNLDLSKLMDNSNIEFYPQNTFRHNFENQN